MNIIVCGSSGFIGGHLVKRLMDEGHYVIGVDIEQPKYNKPHLFFQRDLRVQNNCKEVFQHWSLREGIDEVYNLACIMGGMGFIGDPKYSCDVMVGSTLIVANIIQASIECKVKKSFYSSSACVYNQMLQDKTENVSLSESMAYPASPDLVYGWQKLFSEQIYQASKLNVRIARFHNIYGPEGTYKGGKEKAPAAMCRKVIERDDNQIEVWGSGKQTRSFLYIDDCIDAVRLLMESDFQEPINIGSEEMVSINELAQMAISHSGNDIEIKNIDGPIGVMGRNSDNTLIRKVINWEPKFSLKEGLEKTFFWIKSQYEKVD
jgi:GDP-D-mannose 3',5'-epimerase